MPPVFGPCVAVAQALVVLAGGERQHVRAVAMTMKLASSPCEELLDHDARAGVAELVLRRASRRSRRALRPTLAATTTPLPAARPSALTTIGAPRLSTYAVRLGARR